MRHTLGDGAVAQVATAVEHIHRIDPAIKGTWGAYDLEWIRELWLDGLRKNLGAFEMKPGGYFDLTRISARESFMENDTGFQLSDELSALREQVRRIIRDEIIPLEKKLDPDAAEIPEDDYWRIATKVQAAGMWCMSAPKKYGGGGLGTFDMCVLQEEMAQHRMGLYNPGASVFGRNPPPVIYGGTEEQIQKYVVPTLKNAWYTFFAITEPSGGSDPAGSIQCRAVRKGDTYVLNGSKIFISHAHEAEWGVVFTRTDPKAGRGGITCFIVHKGTPGFTARPFATLRTAALPNEVHFEDCVIPAEQRLGAEGQGLNLALDLLTRLRFPYSAANVGVGVAALRMAIDHAKTRSTFGELLAKRQAIQWMLRGFGSRTARGAMAHVGGRMEG